jgi:DNA-binding SARP family transcriptional activator
MRRLVEAGAEGSGDYLHVDRHEVGFRTESAYWLDIQVFETLLADSIPRSGASLTGDRATALEEAVELYRGDLLEGVYEDWVIFERERLRELLLMALDRLMEYHRGREAWSEAITHGQRLLGIDPLREHVHRELMRLHYLRGDRAAALRQYDACRRLLRHELKVDPMEETVRLRLWIVDQRPIANLSELNARSRKGPAATERSPRGGGPSKETLDTALKELTLAGHLVDRARQRLQGPSPLRTQQG